MVMVVVVVVVVVVVAARIYYNILDLCHNRLPKQRHAFLCS